MSPDFLTSFFEIRKRYFIGGEPSEIGKGEDRIFRCKFPKSKLYSDYTLVGEGRVERVYRLLSSDKDYSFASSNGWNFVIDFQNIRKYPLEIPGKQVLSESVLKKLSGQRPFGVELTREDSTIISKKIGLLLSGS